MADTEGFRVHVDHPAPLPFPRKLGGQGEEWAIPVESWAVIAGSG